jgi:mannosyltransferase OCH1-like enzyme
MIPKTIHYCWFGRGQMPKLAIKCLESWDVHLSGFERKLWTEDNFDLNINPYVKEAYESRKFAFVTDFVRLYALYNEGGIYMDTDVEVLKPLDKFLDLPAFSGFESAGYVPTGIMASEKNGKWVKELLEYYDNRHFILPDGSFDMTTNTAIISNHMQANGFVLKNGYQVYRNCMHMFPFEYFSPLQYGKIFLTENSHTIHHFASSWNPEKRKLKKFILKKIIGGNLTYFLVKIKRRITGKSIHDLPE